MKKPQKTNNNNFAKKEIKPLENDYRSERDQRTIFVKNLPFSSHKYTGNTSSLFIRLILISLAEL